MFDLFVLYMLREADGQRTDDGGRHADGADGQRTDDDDDGTDDGTDGG